MRELVVSEWEFVKRRTAADGAVWRSADGQLYKRTGDAAVRAEAEYQLFLAEHGYPVPTIVDHGVDACGTSFFVERCAGTSLHDQALADGEEWVSDRLIDDAVTISVRLLEAQARNPLPTSEDELRTWCARAGFTANVHDENPDLNTPRARVAVEHAIQRLLDVPMCASHLDYGLPNAFPGGVIDWQHHGPAPIGYDVYPMLDIAAFKGGNRGYRFTPEQQMAYREALDEASTRLVGAPLSSYLGEFLLVKSYFFLALMRPTDPTRHDKYLKWQYRRALFEMGLAQYESSGTIGTDTFPTLADFAADRHRAAAGHS